MRLARAWFAGRGGGLNRIDDKDYAEIFPCKRAKCVLVLKEFDFFTAHPSTKKTKFAQTEVEAS
jgi:hypothetical protein